MKEELMNNICNPNYDFRLGEDIYQRFRFPFEGIKAGSRIIIYGGGVVGKIFLQQVARSAYCTVRAICDRNYRDTGIIEVPVISLAELAGLPDTEYDVILIALEQRNIAIEVREDLIMAGVSTDKIIYFNPSV